jgi:ribosomal protein L7/L12
MNLESKVEELQGRVATLESQMQVILEHLGVARSPDGDLHDQLLELMRSNRKIEAIKVYREHTGLGLKEAKDFVEDLERGLGR